MTKPRSFTPGELFELPNGDVCCAVVTVTPVPPIDHEHAYSYVIMLDGTIMRSLPLEPGQEAPVLEDTALTVDDLTPIPPWPT